VVSEDRHRVVVVGGGFGGLQATLKVCRTPVDVTLVDRRNFHLFQPLAYQVATGALSPGEICYPLRVIFRRRRNVRVVMAEVTGFDLAARRVEIEPVGSQTSASISYDTLIVAGGSHYSYFGHDDWQAAAPELKSLEGALVLRHRILRAFEAAEVEPDRDRRAAWLTFVIVGGGATGVEMAGQIGEIARDTRRDFRAIDTRQARILLVEMSDRLLGTFPASLSAKAARSLERLGVTPRLGETAVDINDRAVRLQDQQGGVEHVPARTVIWAAGVAVEPDLSLPGHPEVLAIGDMVRIRRDDDEPLVLPGVAPVAMQQGRYAAKLVRNRLAGRQTAPFHYRDKGNLATIGRASAVADLNFVRLSGFAGWIVWLTIHLWYLIGFQNRLLVLIRWSFSFFTHGRGARLITGEDGPASR
jgi:NADH dehydrogenase